jgi:hypothetical protein
MITIQDGDSIWKHRAILKFATIHDGIA